MFYISLLTGIIAVFLAFRFLLIIRKEPKPIGKVGEIAHYISTGAKSYLLRQLKTISLVTPFLFVALLLLFNWQVAFISVLGVFVSLLGSFIGMFASTYVNSRVTNSASESTGWAFRLAVLGGSITGLCVTGLSLFVLSILYLIFKDYTLLIGFGFGASLAALFAQIGGGIFTKSADIGADLVGKVESGLPEDDPRNPGVIADLVGDNVGDCAGRGSDLFQTFSDDIVTGTLIASTFLFQYGPKAIFFPILFQCCGIVSSLVAISITKQWNKKMKPETSFTIGLAVAAVLSLLTTFIMSRFILPDISIWIGVLFGVVITLVAAISTRHYAGMEGGPVKKMAEFSKRGAAINVIVGLGYGLQSPIISIIIIVVSIILAYTISGGSILAIIGINIGTDLLIAYIMAADAFGPIIDNAGGIAEMSGSSEKVVGSLSGLDSVGNTMKAITKAYAMSSGTVTAFVIFATFFTITKITTLNVSDPISIGFLLIGISLPYLISSLVIAGTAKGAFLMVDEIRRQFREIKGLLQGKANANYAECVDITAKNALKEMVLPGLISILVPVIVGFLFGAKALGPLLIGSVVSAALLGPFFNNTGTAFDNTKKRIQMDRSLKGSPQLEAAIIGDTIGDPMKDVAGPSILIFMKLVGMSALLIAPLLV